MIEAIVVAVLALATLAYVMTPLRRPRPGDSTSAGRLEDADARRRAAFGGLVDIEGERAMGKLSDADFEALRAEYEGEALAALKELDELGRPIEDDELEREIAELRTRLSCPACGALKTPGEPCERCRES